MDFLKLIQQKEQKIDNKIIMAMVILVFLIMSAVVFWPTHKKNYLLAYLPDDASFYYHFTTKKDLTQAFFAKEIVQERTVELEKLLAGNFLNLQEVLWFQTAGDITNNSYLLKFSRLPKSFLDDLAKENSQLKAYSPEKNILLITEKDLVAPLLANEQKKIYFPQGASIYWQKNKAPEFLNSLASILEPVFQGEDLLLNWQKLSDGKTRLSLLENNQSDIKNIKYFLTPENFDSVLAFNKTLPDDLAENISTNLLKVFFDSLPYYNLSSQVLKSRILTDSIIWQDGETWLLASDKPWQDDILDFMKTLTVKEVPKVLSDGTAYTELVAADEQTIIEHQINGQMVQQIDQLFIWETQGKHYLSNKKELIAELTISKRYLKDLWFDCLDDAELSVGDFMSFTSQDIPAGVIKDYLLANNISSLKAISYATGTMSGLNVCF